ncbi:ActS/PrrB/RegB family redox-sensitive histidine kinase [Aliiroseovarius sp. KMU-50]|uniref:histidine kinase n=1 Tax=Aliiroseovarius salicola TaxID=3009082 RepID=A0ABT4VXF6_9RHOB|nr:ActS/PrrB/RegB family redox-sensitive histidine kinase [Aliiroseovarius sp. KMU-50]MDA5092936.1 ActS/PrrB/RegB family redox-sensitive histidine kinase [Aliiroseovarius sp. KMU-50]
MFEPSPSPDIPKVSGQWVSLRTLVLLRWAAILGQITAIAVAILFYSLEINLLFVGLAISLGVSANLITLAFYAKNTRLNERQATLWLLFDTFQLAFMVFLTGGVHNPFVVLIVAPVTVAATALSTRSTMVVGLAAIAATTFVAIFNLPLQTQMGFALRMPEIFVFGLWVAVVVSIGFLGLYTHRISSEIKSMSEALLAAQMALAREQKLTDLGGVVAAAAHELGTPLATIKLVSGELAEELKGQSDLIEDVRLIAEQTDRCRDILHSMGRAGKDDMHIRYVPLSALVEAAAEPHMDRGIEISIAIEGDETDQPYLARRPEIIHGLRNLIQNAVDFASTAVWIDLSWSERKITIRVIDDGRGYAPNVIDRIGDPFIRRRSSDPQRGQRKEYKGMGLGLFIAKTLLERTGARLSFANGAGPYTGRPHPREKSGAIVQVSWRRSDSEKDGSLERRENIAGLGENIHFE